MPSKTERCKAYYLYSVLVAALIVFIALLIADLWSGNLHALLYTDYILCALIGALVGMVEILSRYSDTPFRATFSAPGFIYFAVNSSASVIALFLLGIYNPIGLGPDYFKDLTSAVLFAGFGSALVLRSSFAQAKQGDKTVPIGPGIAIDTLLRVLDDCIDRYLANKRDTFFEKITSVNKWSFETTRDNLMPYCCGLMQNLSIDNQQQLGRIAKEIEESKSSESVKIRLLILALMNLLGPVVLERGIESVEKLRAQSSNSET
ncbi:MAG: hypothetical protein AAF797_14890 [Planctomycetota bacterium]